MIRATSVSQIIESLQPLPKLRFRYALHLSHLREKTQRKKQKILYKEEWRGDRKKRIKRDLLIIDMDKDIISV